MFVYKKTLGGQSKGVWLYVRVWNHTFYIGEAPNYPDGKYRLELLCKSWRIAHVFGKLCIPTICPIFRFSKYRTKEADNNG